MPPPPSPKPARETLTELLLLQGDFVTRLARSLIRDRGLADDIAQRAMMVAMCKPPREPGRLRAWLARAKSMARIAAT